MDTSSTGEMKVEEVDNLEARIDGKRIDAGVIAFSAEERQIEQVLGENENTANGSDADSDSATTTSAKLEFGDSAIIDSKKVLTPIQNTMEVKTQTPEEKEKADKLKAAREKAAKEREEK